MSCHDIRLNGRTSRLVRPSLPALPCPRPQRCATPAVASYLSSKLVQGKSSHAISRICFAIPAFCATEHGTAGDGQPMESWVPQLCGQILNYLPPDRTCLGWGMGSHQFRRQGDHEDPRERQPLGELPTSIPRQCVARGPTCRSAAAVAVQRLTNQNCAMKALYFLHHVTLQPSSSFTFLLLFPFYFFRWLYPPYIHSPYPGVNRNGASRRRRHCFCLCPGSPRHLRCLLRHPTAQAQEQPRTNPCRRWLKPPLFRRLGHSRLILP
ncbi:hypothetical protein LZ30DRAFT_704526 [Colletotrichum cereale]|nr:hypothetical protein LZ30DRAFT_704526 [Colletotrichum cereale]